MVERMHRVEFAPKSLEDLPASIYGTVELARDLQYRLLRLFDAMIYRSEFPEGFREAIKLRGFNTGTGRQPQGPELTAKLQVLNRELEQMLREEGLCRKRRPVPNNPAAGVIDIEAIVRGVMAELARRGLAQ